MEADQYRNIKRSIEYHSVRQYQRDEVRVLAQAGDPDGEFLMGLLAKHPRTRKKWLLRAAARGHADACHELYMDNLPDLTWLYRAAELGLPAAQSGLGCHYATLPQPDLVRSRHWYLQGALGGSGVAMYEIGFTLLLGEGGPADPAGAIEWLEKAAETKAHTAEDASRLLVDVYSGGLYGVTENHERAEYWRQRRLGEQLATAADEGDLTKAQDLIGQGAPVDGGKPGMITPLMLAVGGGYVELAKFLLERGADLKAAYVRSYHEREYRSTPVTFAFNSNDPSTATALFRLLLAHGASPQEMLVSGLQHSPAEALQVLLDAGADPGQVDEEGELPLYHAAPHADKLRLLLRYGARVDGRNQWGSQAIHYACCWGWTTSIRILLDHGADPNSIEDTDGSIDIPLYYTCGHGHLASTKALLAAGADPNFSPTPRTALMRAATHGCSSTVEALLAAGADPKRQDDEGLTALDYALKWQPDLLSAALAHVSTYQKGPIRWRWHPRRTRERKLVVAGSEWTDGHARVVELLTASQ